MREAAKGVVNLSSPSPAAVSPILSAPEICPPLARARARRRCRSKGRVVVRIQPSQTVVNKEEAAHAFEEETRPRARLAPARRLLEVLQRDALPRPLADRLIDLARTPVDYRFLMGRVPTKEQAQRILARMAEREEELSRQLESILASRRFEEG